MQYFLIKLLIRLGIGVLESNLLVREEHEVIDKDFSGLFQSIFRVNGTIRLNFQYELVVVGLLLDTIGLHCILHVTDWGVD